MKFIIKNINFNSENNCNDYYYLYIVNLGPEGKYISNFQTIHQDLRDNLLLGSIRNSDYYYFHHVDRQMKKKDNRIVIVFDIHNEKIDNLNGLFLYIEKNVSISDIETCDEPVFFSLFTLLYGKKFLKMIYPAISSGLYTKSMFPMIFPISKKSSFDIRVFAYMLDNNMLTYLELCYVKIKYNKIYLDLPKDILYKITEYLTIINN